jgi:hypothetical protein
LDLPEGGLMVQENDSQLGDFIKGRLLFIEDYCKSHMLDFHETLDSIEEEMLKKSGSKEKAEFLRTRLFHGVILSTSVLPNWVDKVFLEAMVAVLKGPGAPLFTTSSRFPCISFEAGRFNARRQADTIFKIMFSNRTPHEWLKTSFPSVYRKCYGDQAGDRLKITETSGRSWEICMDNTLLEKSSKIDCSTVIGYLYGALEKLGAKNIVVNHNTCKAEAQSGQKLCLFEISFDA